MICYNLASSLTTHLFSLSTSSSCSPLKLIMVKPIPAGWSRITGHLLVFGKYSKSLPPLANVSLVSQELCREFTDTEIFLLDLWPSYPPIIMTSNPDVGVAMSQMYNLPKPIMIFEAVKAIVGGPTLLSMNASEWKKWRSLFNPGFSSASLMDHVVVLVLPCQKARQGQGWLVGWLVVG
jgi:hypothetical protein